ncbi:MAG: HAMP domain-containing sensor histidine kinase [Elusimicrobiales bacterium]|nr:HAMP domain-containing sensor histidine kinase [Elusimicrobiales bacterium]
MTDTDKKDSPGLLKQMSSVVSHELRNPLAIISNSLYFVRTRLSAGGAEPDPKVSKHLGIIEGEVKHANDVIEQMLAFTRERDLQLAPAKMNAGIDDLAGSYPLPQGVTIKAVHDPEDPKVNVDIEAMRYALRQVMSNAVQAMPEGGGVITLECSHDDKMAHLSFTDAGAGFPGGDGEKAFEPFFTTRPRGVGLGLSIARKYAERHGGTATAENAPGGGARVTISLPILK